MCTVHITHRNEFPIEIGRKYIHKTWRCTHKLFAATLHQQRRQRQLRRWRLHTAKFMFISHKSRRVACMVNPKHLAAQKYSPKNFQCCKTRTQTDVHCTHTSTCVLRCALHKWVSALSLSCTTGAFPARFMRVRLHVTLAFSTCAGLAHTHSPNVQVHITG